jgi:hypothetical protein
MLFFFKILLLSIDNLWGNPLGVRVRHRLRLWSRGDGRLN